MAKKKNENELDPDTVAKLQAAGELSPEFGQERDIMQIAPGYNPDLLNTPDPAAPFMNQALGLQPAPVEQGPDFQPPPDPTAFAAAPGEVPAAGALDPALAGEFLDYQPPPVQPLPAGQLTGGAPAQAGAAVPALSEGYGQLEQSYIDQAQIAGEMAQLRGASVPSEMRRLHAEQAQADADSYSNAIERYENDVAQVNKMTVDQDFWGRRSTGSQIGMAVAMLLGGVGQGLAGGPNMAADVIQNAIKQDIDVQKFNIQRARGGLADKRSALSMLRQKHSDSRTAEALAEKAALSRAQNQVLAKAGRLKGKMAQAKAMALVGQLQIKKDAAQQVLNQKAAIAGMGGKTKINPEMLTTDQRERFVPGAGLATSKQAAKEARQFLDDYNTTDALIGDLERLMETPLSSVNPALRAEAQVARDSLIGKLRLPLLGPGAMTEAERAVLDKIVAEPAAIFSLDAIQRAKLRGLKRTVRRSIESQLKTRGLRLPGDDSDLGGRRGAAQ